MQIIHLLQNHRASVIRVLKDHPDAFGVYKPQEDIKWLLPCEMYELMDDKGNFAGCFGFSRWFVLRDGVKGIELQLSNVYILKQYRKKGLFNKIVEFAKTKKEQDAKEYNLPVWLVLNCEPKNKIAREIYNRKFNFLAIGKDKLWWFEIC